MPPIPRLKPIKNLGNLSLISKTYRSSTTSWNLAGTSKAEDERDRSPRDPNEAEMSARVSQKQAARMV